MKKFVLASVFALTSLGFVTAPALRAQDSDQITIKDPVEFNAYTSATSVTDAKAKAAAIESFLQTYPQSVVKKSLLDTLIDTYQSVGDLDKTVSAAGRLIVLDPSNLRAVVISVYIKKNQGARTQDAQTLDDAAALAQRGLAIVKPAKTTDEDWKKNTSTAYPLFHSAIALDDIVSKKDYKAGVAEYRTELMLYTPDQTTSGPGLYDTLMLAEAYTKMDPKDAEVKPLVQAVWFYARAWNFAPAGFKGQINPKLEYYYKKYHGGLDGLNDVRTAAAASLFPPGTFVLSPAATPTEIAHKVVVETPDLTSLNLGDKEFILAVGTEEDRNKLWNLLKEKATPVPGVVIEASATVIKLAVTDDAKAAKIADFIVNLKKPLEEKEIPAVGAVFGLQSPKGEAELDATYDSYTQVPATDTMAPTAQISLKDGFIQPEKKKAAAPAHKPAAGHKPAAHK
jgi:hypothetical protein